MAWSCRAVGMGWHRRSGRSCPHRWPPAGLVPDGSYAVKSLATDQQRNNVCAYAVFSGTHSGEGGPVPPTGKSTSSDYVYAMQFGNGKISHMTKIWNPGSRPENPARRPASCD